MRIRGRTAAAIAGSVEHALRSGGMSEGQRLPAIRDLAKALRVSPVTVAAAYRLLRSRGLTTGSGRQGTSLRVQAQVAPGALDRNRESVPHLIDLATGNPDPAFLPSLSSALRHVDAGQHLYGGSPELSSLVAVAAAEFVSDGVSPGPVAVTHGGLDAIERILREHTRPGDVVAVEDPSPPGLLDLLSSLALVPAPFRVDHDGPVPESLERALGPTVPAVVLSPRAQDPTGAAISQRRADDLARILRGRSRALVIEIDDSAVVSGCAFVTLSTGREYWACVRSTSKWLGPDLRVALATGDPLTMTRVQRRQAVSIRWVSHLLQRLTLALWSDPASGRLLARAAEVYAQRRNALIEALAAHDIHAHGRSGFNVWIPVREETATVQGLADRGWAVAAGERFRIQSPPAVRVTTSALLPEAAQRFAADFAAAAGPPVRVPAQPRRAAHG